ncbi:MAG: DUF3306 domain-containing protein [Desulfobulbia bacterium]
MTSGSGTDFWSRRKAAVREEEKREEAELEAEKSIETATALEELTDEEICQELDLPDPDELEEGDDIKPFLQTVVPERLRRRALRRLWKLNPTLANLDGLVDYGEDFTDSATVFEGIQTTYQVGKGMLEHIRHLAERAEKDENEGEIEAITEGTDAQPVSETEEESGELDTPPQNATDDRLTESEHLSHSENSDAVEGGLSDNNEAEPVALGQNWVRTQSRRMRFKFS